MKILLVVHDCSLAGAPRVALNVFAELKKQGVETLVLALDGGPLAGSGDMSTADPPLVPSNVAFSDLGTFVDARRATLRYHRARVFARIRRKLLISKINLMVSSFAPDLVYLNSVASLTALGFLQPTGKPLVLHVHEMGQGLRGFWERDGQLIRDLNDARVIVVSEAAKRSFCDQTGISAERVAVIHPCVPPAPSGERLSVEGPVVIGGSGTIEWRKGLQTWLVMAATVVRQIAPEKVRFMWVGAKKGDMASEIVAEQARILGISDSVEFVPVTKEPFRYYRQMDIFAMTSWEDPCPLVVMENMQIGNAVVCFRGGGGAAEEVGDAGVIVEEFSPEAMADEVVKLLKDRERRVRLGQEAIRRAKQMFDCETQARKIFELLHKQP